MRRCHPRAAGLYPALLLAACFGGGFAHGLPCTDDGECGPLLMCVEGLCGGPGDSALCGNGLVDAEEQCDDGNVLNGDGCSENCDYCGDGTRQEWEGCDDGNTRADDLCTPTCGLPVCGDGLLAAGEECDDGNAVGTDGCMPSCKLPACGDGFVAGGEACDDGNAVDGDACTTACTVSPERPRLVLTPTQIKQFAFGWQPALGATHYRLFESRDGVEEPVQVGDDIEGTAVARTVPLHLRSHARYLLRACNAAGRCVESQPVDDVGTMAGAVGYVKASNTAADDAFGYSVALSGDGNTVAVGAPREDSAATGIGGDQSDDSLVWAGAVYVIERKGEEWSYTYFKPTAPVMGMSFGLGVALSGDGNTLAAHGSFLGITHVFVRDPVTRMWSAQHEFPVVASALALSDDGDTLAIGDRLEDGVAMGAGATFVYVREAGEWTLQATLTAANAGMGDGFGSRVAMSGDGDVLAVSAPNERSSDSQGDDDDAPSAGAVYVFERAGDWQPRQLLKAVNAGAWDVFGASLALSRDGRTLAVGASGEDSAATGVDGGDGDDYPPATDPTPHSGAGAAYVFVLGEEGWAQQAYLKASNTGDLDLFGSSVALSGDGRVLAVGATGEDSLSTGIDGAQNDLSGDSGAVYVYVRDESMRWSATPAFVKAPQPISGFGGVLALTDDGDTLIAGAPAEGSAAVGVGGDQIDDGFPNAGAVYVY